MSEGAPAWKFWHPVPTWQGVAVLLLCQVPLTGAMVALRVRGGVEVPFGDALGGAAGGLLAYLLLLALKRRATTAQQPEASSSTAEP